MNSCDSFVILASATEDKRVIVAKNSDREPNEANNLVYFPAKTYPKNTTLHCTYKAISQVEHTYAILLLKPYWIWGGEYGSNQHGVTIANEAVFSPYFEPKNSALLGLATAFPIEIWQFFNFFYFFFLFFLIKEWICCDWALSAEKQLKKHWK